MLEQTLTIILAGGQGTRLHPLTLDRAKPAVPFGGKYRIIDFTLANCLHSGLRKILVLTQYKSHSLQKHLRDGWSIFNPELGAYITPVPPQMRTGEAWYEGTANAIYQNLYMLERSHCDHVLVLSGDHIYRMDYAELLKAHNTSNADVTIACMDVATEDANAFGILAADLEGRVTGFEEKPDSPTPLPGNPDLALASMGIYVFSKDLLIEALKKDHDDPASSHDFGHDILPKLLHNHGVFAFRFGGQTGRVSQDKYWRDVGTIDSFYAANMALLEPIPPLDLYQSDWNIRTYEEQNPPARTVPGASGNEGIFVNSILGGGTIIAGGGVHHSILFPGVKIGDDAIIEDSILFNGVEVGEGANLRRCIVDKNVAIPSGEQIGIDPERDAEWFDISPAGVVVVPKHFNFES